MLSQGSHQRSDLTGEEPLQTPDGLCLGSPFRHAASNVGARRLVVLHPDDDRSVEGGVGLAMTSAVQSVAGRCAR